MIAKKRLYSVEFPDKSVYINKTAYDKISRVSLKNHELIIDNIKISNFKPESDFRGFVPKVEFLTTRKNDAILCDIENRIIQTYRNDGYKVFYIKSMHHKEYA